MTCDAICRQAIYAASGWALAMNELAIFRQHTTDASEEEKKKKRVTEQKGDNPPEFPFIPDGWRALGNQPMLLSHKIIFFRIQRRDKTSEVHGCERGKNNREPNR